MGVIVQLTTGRVQSYPTASDWWITSDRTLLIMDHPIYDPPYPRTGDLATIPSHEWGRVGRGDKFYGGASQT